MIGWKRTLLRALRFSLFTPLLLAVCGISFWVGIGIAVRGEKDVVVPDLVGRPREEARNQAHEVGLSLRVVGKRHDDRVPEGAVVRQEPIPGSDIKQERSVSVYLSLGSRKVTIPSLQGDSLRSVQLVLRREGLRVGHVSYVYSPQTKHQEILAQDPSPGLERLRGTSINLLVSLGDEPDVFIMPELTGRNLEQVKSELKSNGLNVSHVRFELDPEVPENTVVRQFPLSGYKLRDRDLINLTVSRRSQFTETRRSRSWEGGPQL